jgi:hypothetical protein
MTEFKVGDRVKINVTPDYLHTPPGVVTGTVVRIYSYLVDTDNGFQSGFCPENMELLEEKNATDICSEQPEFEVGEEVIYRGCFSACDNQHGEIIAEDALNEKWWIVKFDNGKAISSHMNNLQKIKPLKPLEGDQYVWVKSQFKHKSSRHAKYATISAAGYDF